MTKTVHKRGEFGYKEVQELEFLERCIKESLRLYPSVPTIFRYVDEDLYLSNYFNLFNNNSCF